MLRWVQIAKHKQFRIASRRAHLADVTISGILLYYDFHVAQIRCTERANKTKRGTKFNLIPFPRPLL